MQVVALWPICGLARHPAKLKFPDGSAELKMSVAPDTCELAATHILETVATDLFTLKS